MPCKHQLLLIWVIGLGKYNIILKIGFIFSLHPATENKTWCDRLFYDELTWQAEINKYRLPWGIHSIAIDWIWLNQFLIRAAQTSNFSGKSNIYTNGKKGQKRKKKKQEMWNYMELSILLLYILLYNTIYDYFVCIIFSSI